MNQSLTEATTQAWGLAIFEENYEGILIPSGPSRGNNLIVFPRNLASASTFKAISPKRTQSLDQYLHFCRFQSSGSILIRQIERRLMPKSTTETLKPKRLSANLAGKNGKRLMAWRQSHGITRVTFAQVANCSERKLATYEKLAALPKPVQRQTTEAVRLLGALNEIISEAQLSEWLKAPNPGFNGRSPVDVMSAGETDLLWDMIYQTRAGAFAQAASFSGKSHPANSQRLI